MLSGAMDVVAVGYPDGSMKCSSFHVRFGSLKVLKSKKKRIMIYVNGQKTDVTMRLSGNGDAYFVFEEQDKNDVLMKKSHTNDVKFVNPFKPLNEDSIQNNNGEYEELYRKFEDYYSDGDNSDEDSLEDINEQNNINSNVNINNSNQNQTHNVFVSRCKKEIQNLVSKNDIDKIEEEFIKNVILKEEFQKEPWKILNDKNNVFYYDGSLFDDKTGVPLFCNLLLYNEPLPEQTISNISNKGFFKLKSTKFLSKIKLNDQNTIKKGIQYYKKKNAFEDYKKKYKSFTPSLRQLKQLNLKPGQNEISFVCKSRLYGTNKITSYIYLWPPNSKIIISDIDGTITKSDVLGQVLPVFGKDWSQKGIANLFSNIANNGYKFLYLTARAIGQSGNTRGYITSLFQGDKKLPPGPLLMSPNGLISSFKREVIDKTPEILKISVLKEINMLFNNENCFYAGFGNRQNDAVAYRTVGIKSDKIFIVDPHGNLVQLDNSAKKSYTLLNDIVNITFPKI